MGNTRGLSRKFETPREYFHAKERNSMDVTNTEDIKKKRQEYTEKLYKKSSQPR